MRLVYVKDDAILRMKREVQMVMGIRPWAFPVEHVWSPVERSLNIVLTHSGGYTNCWIGSVR